MQPDESIVISLGFQGMPPNVILPATTVLPGVILHTLTVTFIPMGPDGGDRLNTGAAASKAAGAAHDRPNTKTKAKKILLKL
jgi:hypothetical protein